jgi:hypothetical protein
VTNDLLGFQHRLPTDATFERGYHGEVLHNRGMVPPLAPGFAMMQAVVAFVLRLDCTAVADWGVCSANRGPRYLARRVRRPVAADHEFSTIFVDLSA